jgi:hypothetical protein
MANRLPIYEIEPALMAGLQGARRVIVAQRKAFFP